MVYPGTFTIGRITASGIISGATSGSLGGVTFINNAITAGTITTTNNGTITSTGILTGATSGSIGGVTFINNAITAGTITTTNFGTITSTGILTGATSGSLGGVTFINSTINAKQIYNGDSINGNGTNNGTLLIGVTFAVANLQPYYIPARFIGPTGTIGIVFNTYYNSFNKITKIGDNLIYFSDNVGGNTSSGLCIGPHNTVNASGIRITNQGVAINTAFNDQGATGALYVTGDIVNTGQVNTNFIANGTTGTVNIGTTANYANSAAGFIPAAFIGPTGRNIQIGLNMGFRNYNPIVTKGDNIIFSKDTYESGNTGSGLCICTHTATTSGIRITNYGVAINTNEGTATTGVTGSLYVSGQVVINKRLGNTGAILDNGGLDLSGGILSNMNFGGGSTGSLIYQSQTNGTTFLPIGIANNMLLSNGTSPYWGSVLASNATNLVIEGNSTSTDIWYPTFVIGGTGDSRRPTVSQSGLQFQPSTGNLTVSGLFLPSDRSLKQGIYDLNDVNSILHSEDPTPSDVVYDVNPVTGEVLNTYTIVNDGGETADDGLTSTNGIQEIQHFNTDGIEDYAKKQYRVDDLYPKIYQIKCPDGSMQTQIGFLADDFVGKDLNFLVGTAEIDGQTKNTLNYIGLIGLLTQEIKELKTSMQLLLASMPASGPSYIQNLKVIGIIKYVPLS
jgi:hypothetical protein